jgi:RNA polymerase sigma factor (sigma-70 family)
MNFGKDYDVKGLEVREPASTGKSAAEGEPMPMSWAGCVPAPLADVEESAAPCLRIAPTQIKRLVAALTAEVDLRKDLEQEAWLHLWHRQQEHPGQTDSWYLHSCRLHLHNLMRKGRSVDAWKRRGARLSEFETVEWLEQECGADSAGDPSGALEAQELLSLLLAWITPREKRVLQLLTDRLSAREIGRQLGISHTMVNRERRRIGAVAVKLGLAP